jgi:hypothetical protein
MSSPSRRKSDDRRAPVGSPATPERRAVRAQGMAVTRLAETLQDAVDLLRDTSFPTSGTLTEPVERGTLLQQCLALCERQQQQPPEAVRTVHHFASSGGTLICKCIAAMPNVQLLSEVDPLSTMQHHPDQRPRFAPTDMAAQLRQSSRGVREDLLIELFHHELRLVHADATENGQRLVVRDHAHGHFCYGPTIFERPTLRELMPPGLPVLSILTVRDPVARFISLTQNKWLQFRPATLDEYCRRYLAFLDRYADVPVFRYEDFVARPGPVLQQICEVLDLPFNDGFEDFFDVFKISGDSGRSGARIAPRGPRADETEFRAAARASAHYRAVADRLGYPDERSDAADASAAQ